MSETSSEDEERFKILQAVDKQFMNNEMYSKPTAEDAADKTTLPPSLRYSEDHSDQNPSGLKVTPEFQKYVAKQLSHILDSQLKEVDKRENRHKKKRKIKDRVRLLHGSNAYLTVKEAEDISAAHNAKRKSRIAEQQEVVSGEEDVRLAETAVSAEWILSGEATRGWVKSTKGEVIPGEFKNSGLTSGKIKKRKKKKTVDKIGKG